MSTPRCVSCTQALDQLWELLDQECDAVTSDALQAHLEACQRCYPHYDFQRAYRTFIAQRCRHAAPPELRKKVFMSLLREEGRA